MKDGFFGPYRWLSNFYPSPVEFEGVIYPCVENAYQAAKFNHGQRAAFKTCTAALAKRTGRTAKLSADWQSRKLVIMRNLLRQKFSDPGFARALLATNDMELIEWNDWGDTFWGKDMHTRKGQNHLGRMLMEIREELRATKAA